VAAGKGNKPVTVKLFPVWGGVLSLNRGKKHRVQMTRDARSLRLRRFCKIDETRDNNSENAVRAETPHSRVARGQDCTPKANRRMARFAGGGDDLKNSILGN
jgi:hypothetical protein